MKKSIINTCLLILIDVLLILSVFLPLINIVTYNPNTGTISKYYNLIYLLKYDLHFIVIPYIIFLLSFIITSIFINKNKIIRIINLLSLFVISLVGITALIILFSIASLYGLVYIFSILIVLKSWDEIKN